MTTPNLPRIEPELASGVESGRRSDASYAPPNRLRRMMVGGVALAYAASWLPESWAADAPAPSDAALPDFMTVSTFITGRTQLDTTQASRLSAAMQANDPQFAKNVHDFAAFLASRKPDTATLQTLLDTEKATFAALPRQIATAWFVGVVGSSTHARCMTYVSSLMNVIVSDTLRPSSYAYGAYGTWGSKPTQSV